MAVIVDNRFKKVADFLGRYLKKSSKADICVAYISLVGAQSIEQELEKFLSRGSSLRLLISDENSKDDIKAIKDKFGVFSSADIRVYPSDQRLLHAKLYLFYEADTVYFIIGSSNLTVGGLLSNIEHNLVGSEQLNSQIIQESIESFESLWAQGLPIEEFHGKLQTHPHVTGGAVMASEHPFTVELKKK